MLLQKGEKMRNTLTVLNTLGKTDAERATKLGVSLRTFQDYKLGRFPNIINRFMRFPNLLMAMALDAEEREQGQQTTDI